MAAYRGPDLTIENGETESNVVELRGARAITIHTPGTLPESVQPYSCPTEDGDFMPLLSGEDEIVLAAGVAQPIVHGALLFLKLVAGGAVAAERVFPLIVDEG